MYLQRPLISLKPDILYVGMRLALPFAIMNYLINESLIGQCLINLPAARNVSPSVSWSVILRKLSQSPPRTHQKVIYFQGRKWEWPMTSLIHVKLARPAHVIPSPACPLSTNRVDLKYLSSVLFQLHLQRPQSILLSTYRADLKYSSSVLFLLHPQKPQSILGKQSTQY